MTDKTLAALIQSDPEKGLAAALELYGDCCAGILHRMLGSTQDAEDCLGTMFCKLWKTIGQYDPEKSSLKSWICRITRNTAIDMLRKSGLEILPLDEELPDCSDSPEMLLQKKEMMADSSVSAQGFSVELIRKYRRLIDTKELTGISLGEIFIPVRI